jgi:hypothetical protein
MNKFVIKPMSLSPISRGGRDRQTAHIQTEKESNGVGGSQTVWERERVRGRSVLRCC